MTRYALDVTTSVAAQVPHPFHFQRNRSISGTLPLTREETAVHLHVLAVVPAGPSFAVTVFGGPTNFSLKQGLVNDVRFTHSYSYDDATYSDAVTGTQSASTIWVLHCNSGRRGRFAARVNLVSCPINAFT